MSAYTTHVFTTTDPAVPENERALARIRMMMVSGGKAGRKATMQWGVIVFHGRDDASVRAKVDAWWQAQADEWTALKGKGRTRRLAEVDEGERVIPQAIMEMAPAVDEAI